MDCSYLAAAAARIVSRFQRHDGAMVVLVAEACGRAATICADLCSGEDAAAIRQCAELSRRCAEKCRALVVGVTAERTGAPRS